MVEHVFLPIQILQVFPVFVHKDLPVYSVMSPYQIIHALVIRVKHMVFVHYQQQIRHIPAFVILIIRVVNVKDVRDKRIENNNNIIRVDRFRKSMCIISLCQSRRLSKCLEYNHYLVYLPLYWNIYRNTMWNIIN